MIAEDVPVAVNTTIDALTNDPVQYYLTLTPNRDDDNKLKQAMLRFSVGLNWAKHIHDNAVWTINGGESLIVSYLKPKKPIDTVVDAMFSLVVAALSPHSKEQKKRMKECREKMRKCIRESIGNRIDTMLGVFSLATAPAKQGRGFATRLFK